MDYLSFDESETNQYLRRILMKSIDKKTYTAPVIKKVSLAVKNSILQSCHTSPENDPVSSEGLCQLNLAECHKVLPE